MDSKENEKNEKGAFRLASRPSNRSKWGSTCKWPRLLVPIWTRRRTHHCYSRHPWTCQSIWRFSAPRTNWNAVCSSFPIESPFQTWLTKCCLCACPIRLNDRMLVCSWLLSGSLFPCKLVSLFDIRFPDARFSACSSRWTFSNLRSFVGIFLQAPKDQSWLDQHRRRLTCKLDSRLTCRSKMDPFIFKVS